MRLTNKNIQNVIVILFVGTLSLFGQSIKSDKNGRKIPNEKIFVHYNSTLLFAGEYLLYKVYNLNHKGLSSLSKIAYVELVGEDMEIVFKHKVRLENSAGQGDFFIPSTVKSGNYKLIAYTKWMRNGSENDFFQGEIAIINPYQSDQKKILKDSSNISTRSVALNPNKKKLSIPEVGNSSVKIRFEQDVFKRRAKVSLRIEDVSDSYSNGSYSISVRNMDTIKKPQPLSSETFKESWGEEHETSNTKIENLMYLPEYRGEYISGRIYSEDSTMSVESEKVAISIPEENGYVLKVVATDKNGMFSTNLEKEYSGTKMVVQVLGENRKKYKLALDQETALDYSDLVFNRFKITPKIKDMIVERSVHNQIENGYFSIKPDSIKPIHAIVPNYQGMLYTYNLDDYTRFSTVGETLVEVVELVWAKRIGQDEYTFQIKENDYDFYTSPDFPPLIIVDGILVQNHTHLLQYNARNVKSISFLRDKYIVGPKIFQGVLVVETIDKDYVSPYGGEHRTSMELFRPLPKKSYYYQEYGNETDLTSDRILDFRYQLYWDPNLTLSDSQNEVIFYTSDIPGEYEMVLEGFSSSGNPVSVKRKFMVE